MTPIVTLVRVLRRLLALLLWVVWGVLALALGVGWLSWRHRGPWVQSWSRGLLRAVGVRWRCQDELVSSVQRGNLLIANHISWLDIFALNAWRPTIFVAKSEIRRWPVLGWMVAAAGSIFVERGSRHAIRHVNQQVASALSRGDTVGVFPEGTTSTAHALLNFHANLFEPALAAKVAVQPVSLCYVEAGRVSPAADWLGDQSFLANLWQVLATPALSVELVVLPQVSTDQDGYAGGRARHELAAAVRAEIDQSLQKRCAQTD